MVTITIPGKVFHDIELIIFDKDGTMIDLYQYWSEMILFRATLIRKEFDLTPQQMIRVMYAMGVDLQNKRILPDGPVGIKKREEVMMAAIRYLESVGCVVQDIHAACESLFEEADQMSLSHLNQISVPIPGARDLIDSLHRESCKIAIATTDRSYRADLAMKTIGFDDKIDLIVGTDMVEKTKPHTDMIDYILNKLCVSEKHTLMVGDAITDIAMGNKANVAGSIGVLTGMTGRKTLEQFTPYIVESIASMKVYGDDATCT